MSDVDLQTAIAIAIAIVGAGQAAARAAQELRALDPPPSAYPWFWTDLGEHNLQMLGLKTDDLHYVHRRTDANRGVWLGLRGGIPIHGVALKARAALRTLRPLFERQISIDPQTFADPSTPLRRWARSHLSPASHS